MPEIDQVRQSYEAKGVGFLAVTFDPNMGRVRQAVSELNLKMPFATSLDPLMSSYGFPFFPATIFVNADGTVNEAESGERSQAFFQAKAEELIASRK